MNKDIWLMLSPLIAIFCLGVVLFIAGIVVQSGHILAIGCVCIIFMGAPCVMVYIVETK